MIENTVMEPVKQVIWVIMLIGIIILTIFGIQYGQSVNFKQETNYIIEREGGLTATALTRIHEHSNEFYNGRYRVVSANKMNQKVKYGEMVTYVFQATYKVGYFNIPDIHIKYGGAAASKVR